MRNRDLVWTQFVSRLHHDNLLVSAKSYVDPRVRPSPSLAQHAASLSRRFVLILLR